MTGWASSPNAYFPRRATCSLLQGDCGKGEGKVPSGPPPPLWCGTVTGLLMCSFKERIKNNLFKSQHCLGYCQYLFTHGENV